MRILFTAVALFAVFGLTSVTGAQSPPPEESIEGEESSQSIEHWYYQEMLERYDNPKTAVRKKAEFRAQQRRGADAATKWYGFSNSRPVAAAVPFTSHLYSPRWEGSRVRPYTWHTNGRPTVVVRPYYHVYR